MDLMDSPSYIFFKMAFIHTNLDTDKTDFFTHLSHVRRLEHCRDNHDVTKDTAYYHQCIQCDKCIKYRIGYSLIVKDILQ